jgi:tetratricopeptide (TPR) repeat protein
MGEIAQTANKKKDLWKWIFAGCAIVLVAGGAGALVSWQQHQRNLSDAAKPTAVEQKASDIQNSVAAGNFDAAHKELTTALQNSKLSNDDRYTLLVQQALTYENEKNYPQAIKILQQAEAIKPTQDVAESIGRNAAANNQKDLAISSYKKAISRLDKNSPVTDADKERYENLIRSLGGQP